MKARRGKIKQNAFAKVILHLFEGAAFTQSKLQAHTESIKWLCGSKGIPISLIPTHHLILVARDRVVVDSGRCMPVEKTDYFVLRDEIPDRGFLLD